MIDRARQLNPRVKEPNGLLVYQKGKMLGEYQLTAIDNMVIRVAKRAKISRKTPITLFAGPAAGCSTRLAWTSQRLPIF